jgi:hypothetical protein
MPLLYKKNMSGLPSQGEKKREHTGERNKFKLVDSWFISRSGKMTIGKKRSCVPRC